MSNPTRIGQEAPDLKTPSSPSRITPTRALDDNAEHQMSKSEPPAPKYPYVVDEAGVARVGYVAVDPAQHNKATELQLWPLGHLTRRDPRRHATTTDDAQISERRPQESKLVDLIRAVRGVLRCGTAREQRHGHVLL